MTGDRQRKRQRNAALWVIEAKLRELRHQPNVSDNERAKAILHALEEAGYEVFYEERGKGTAGGTD